MKIFVQQTFPETKAVAGQSLGLIETRGLVPAIVAADAACKAAMVALRGCDTARGGLVTIKLTGDVAAVRAAVNAGGAAAEKVGEVISLHVIPRPDLRVGSMREGPGRPPGGVKPPFADAPVEDFETSLAVEAGVETPSPFESPHRAKRAWKSAEAARDKAAKGGKPPKITGPKRRKKIEPEPP